VAETGDPSMVAEGPTAEFCFASADRLAQLRAGRAVSVEEVVRASRQRIERLDRQLKAVVALRAAGAVERRWTSERILAAMIAEGEWPAPSVGTWAVARAAASRPNLEVPTSRSAAKSRLGSNSISLPNPR